MERISAGIVTYNPDMSRLLDNISNVVEQVEKVFVVDNGSINCNEIVKLQEKVKFELIINHENEGIAKALNQLCEKAKQEGFSWMLTLDQDSICQLDMVQIMKKHISTEFGIVCPAIKYNFKKANKNKQDYEYPYACMTSGSLTQIDAWSSVKGFEEQYFIDFVDNEFCMKLAIKGYKILRINACILDHQLGETITVEKKGTKKTYSKHSNLRYYYMARNNLHFIKKYRDYLNVFKEYCKLMYIVSGAIIHSSEKKETIKYIKQGLRDGKNNKLGKLV